MNNMSMIINFHKLFDLCDSQKHTTKHRMKQTNTLQITCNWIHRRVPHVDSVLPHDGHLLLLGDIGLGERGLEQQLDLDVVLLVGARLLLQQVKCAQTRFVAQSDVHLRGEQSLDEV